MVVGLDGRRILPAEPPVGVWGATLTTAMGEGGVVSLLTLGPEVPTSGEVTAGVRVGLSTALSDEVRLVDAASGEVYVCFEGHLGAHLKSAVRELIWKGEYVEIFSLLPLEKFNLDWVKLD